MQIDISDAEVRISGSAIFSGLSARIPSGRVTAIVGPSGSGKSTLLAAISGYQRLSKGRVDIYGSSSASPTPPDPALVAWAPQGSNALGRRSVLDNVMIASLGSGSDLNEARTTAAEALHLVGLGGMLGVQARRLSGGELQRVALARALASGKGIVLADEPSANLDAANTELLAEILHGLTSNATVVVATHDPVLMQAASGSVRLRKGAPLAR